MFTFTDKGEAWPPPTSPSLPRPWFVALGMASIMALLLYSPSWCFAQPQSPPKSQKSSIPYTRPSKINPAPHANTWAFSTNKPRPVDQIWTRGLAPQAIKQAAVAGLKNKALKSELKAPSVPEIKPPAPSKSRANNLETPPQLSESKGLPVGKAVHVRGDSLSSSWHNSTLKNDMRIDQDVIRQETNVYGAYTDIEASEDLTLSAGPEFSHTRTQSTSQHSPVDTGSLGLGVQLKWGF